MPANVPSAALADPVKAPLTQHWCSLGLTRLPLFVSETPAADIAFCFHAELIVPACMSS